MKLRPALLTFLALALFAAGLGRALAAAPVVSNVRAAQRAGTQLVDIDYDLSATLAVTVAVSTNDEATSCGRAARNAKGNDFHENK